MEIERTFFAFHFSILPKWGALIFLAEIIPFEPAA